MTARVVVVGAGLAGLRLAEAVRGAGFTDELIVVGDEPHLPYNRPPLSKEALAEGVSVESLAFRRRASVADVTWRLGVGAVGLDLAAHEVLLADGDRLAFDGLGIATGVRPRRLDLAGSASTLAPRGGRHVIRTVEDAARLRAELTPGRRIVVLGAGFIGCEVAATARKLGCEVDVVAPEAVPMQRPLGLAVGAAMQLRHEAAGVRFHLGRLPAALTATTVQLDDGSDLPADVVLEALGCIPATEWLVGSGLDVQDGVRTDGWLRALDEAGVARPDVVAAGDVARFPNALFDDVPRRVEHWAIPTDTGKRAGPALVAGLAAAGLDPAPFAPMPSFWSDQYGARLQSFGALGLADSVELLDGDLTSPSSDFVAGYLRAGQLVGVAGVGLMPRLLGLRGELLAALAPTA